MHDASTTRPAPNRVDIEPPASHPFGMASPELKHVLAAAAVLSADERKELVAS